MHQLDMPIDYYVWVAVLERYQIHTKADQLCRATCKVCFVDVYEMICHRGSLLRQSYHSAADFDRVLLQLVNILFK